MKNMFKQLVMHSLNDFLNHMHYHFHQIKRFSIKSVSYDTYINHDTYNIYNIYYIVTTANFEFWYRIFVRKLISDIIQNDQNFIVKLDKICYTQYSDFDKYLVFDHAEKLMIKNFWHDMLKHLDWSINIKLHIL